MKKVLLASTALVCTAGIAAADGHSGVSLSGFAEMGVFDNGTDGNKLHLGDFGVESVELFLAE